MFHVGQKVVCVDAEECWDQLIMGLRAAIREGAVYTIAWCGEYDGKTCVRLVGILRDHPLLPEHPFRASRFRPIQERKTDIGFAHEILRKVTKQRPVGSPVVKVHEAVR